MNGRELVRWTVVPERSQTYASAPFRLPVGLHELTLESDGEERPRHPRDAIAPMMIPYSLCVRGVNVQPATLVLRLAPDEGQR